MVIDEEVPDVTPEPLDQGACAQPGPSGLYALSLRSIGTQQLEGTQPFEIGAVMTLLIE